ncbi:MAG TPA: hypothetical protein DEV81_23640 [Cyanobacteria bacterium UBA11049]|nr:hypothetical protein [Cyanobacteria bacterium UBA11049]
MSLSEPLQQLNKDLMALRDHYQAILTEAEHKANLTLEQLKHVDALIVDRFGNSQQFIPSLIALRSHLQTILVQHQQQAVHAREQLTHVHALLANRLVQQSQESISIPAATYVEQQQLAPSDAVEMETQEPTSHSPQVEENTPSEATEPDLVEDSQASSSASEVEESSQLFSLTKTQMLPQYDHLSKIQAVERLLRENAGSILHVDYIIRALYGELDALAIKAEKPRMYDTLTQGTKKGLWVKVPDVASCYTYDLKLVQPNSSSKNNNSVRTHSRRRTSPARGKQPEQMLPDYQHLNLTAAVETAVNKYAGEILTTERIAKELYGEISGRELTQAKDKIGKTLWSGTRQGRWQHVPGKLGCYTLDLSSVNR